MRCLICNQSYSRRDALQGHECNVHGRRAYDSNFGLEFIDILKDERQIIAQYAPKLARRHMHGKEPFLR